MRILGEPKSPQTGKFSSKVAKKPVTQPNVKPAKKVPQADTHACSYAITVS